MLRVKKATAEREKLRGADGLWLDIDDEKRQVHCKVHVVSEYRHLGTWVTFFASMEEGSGDGAVLATGCEGVWQ